MRFARLITGVAVALAPAASAATVHPEFCDWCVGW
jgi:hypothetical protein